MAQSLDHEVKVYDKKEVIFEESLNEHYGPDEDLQNAVERASLAPLDRDAAHAAEMASLAPLGRDAPWRLENLHNMHTSCDLCSRTYFHESAQRLFFIAVWAESSKDMSARASPKHKAMVLICVECASEFHYAPFNLLDLGVYFLGVGMSVWEKGAPWC